MKHLNEIVVMTVKLTLEIDLAGLRFFFCFFLQNASQVVLSLVDLIASDKCCICYHVGTVTQDTASIIEESVLSREPPPHTYRLRLVYFLSFLFPPLSLPFVLPPSMPHATVCLHF